MDAGEVFRKHGAPKCWTTPGSTVDGIGFTLGHGSWPVFDARQATTRRAIVRNPAVLDEPARWTGTWQPRHLTGIWFIDYFAGIGEANKQVGIPWNPDWKGPGGTQPAAADNGIIITDVDGSWWELLGMAPASWPQPSGAYRVDGCSHLRPGDKVQGSQGPWPKLDGLLRPSWLTGPWPGPVRLVGFNVAYGPGAKAAPGARVEHPRPGLPSGYAVALPSGDDPRMLRCGQPLKVRITDQRIEEWLDSELVPLNSTLRVSKRWAAIGMRTHGMRLSETGTGPPILESSGGAVDAAEWKACGISTEADANNLCRNLFRFGELVAA